MTFEFYQFKSVKFGRCDRTKELGYKKTRKFRVKTKNSGSVPEDGQISNFLKEDIQLVLSFV